MIKVMVVGSAGQVGQELVKRAPSEWRILATDRSQLDITDAQQVNSVVSSFSPDVIINAAAYTAVDKAESEPELAFAINRDGRAIWLGLPTPAMLHLFIFQPITFSPAIKKGFTASRI